MLTSGIDYLQSPLLLEAGFRHAFFTRLGGVSEGPYASLSFSVAAGDEPEKVEENLRRAAQSLQVEPERLLFLSQVHGTVVHEVDESATRAASLERQGDAVLSASPQVGCGVRSADCVPLLLAAPESGAVCAAHAGWRGVAQGMAVVAVEALRKRAGSMARILAAIGPHISEEAFEVGADVAEQLEACRPGAGGVDWKRTPKPHVSLARILEMQLVDAGLPKQHIDWVRGCTVMEPARFFSFRRDGAKSGRHLSAIVARPPRQ